MNSKTIIELAEMVVNEMARGNLKPKTIADFERYGLRPILKYYSEIGQACYSRKQTRKFVNVCRQERKNGKLSEYKWCKICRAAALFEKYAHEQRRTRALQVLLVEGLAKSVTLDEIETLIVAVRDEILKLDYSKKTKRHYIYSGLGAVLSYFHNNNCHDFSKQLLEEMVSERYNDYTQGKSGRFK